jgi:hypothetical protein
MAKVNSHVASNNIANHKKPIKNDKKATPKPQSDLDLLLDLNFDTVSSGFSSNYSRCLAVSGPGEFFSLLSPLSSNGLTIEARFSRSPSVFSNSMLSIELQIYFSTKGLDSADIHLHFDKVNYCEFKINQLI